MAARTTPLFRYRAAELVGATEEARFVLLETHWTIDGFTSRLCKGLFTREQIAGMIGDVEERAFDVMFYGADEKGRAVK